MSLVVMCFACLILLVMVASMTGKDRQFNVTIHTPTPHLTNQTDICLSEECVKVAASILTAAELNQDPCEDFYQVSFIVLNH